MAEDNGQIFKITGVFNGTPALATSGGWAASGVTVAGAAGTVMTSPVLDSASGNIFLGSSNGNAYSVQASAPATQSIMTVGSGIGTNAGGIISSKCRLLLDHPTWADRSGGPSH